MIAGAAPRAAAAADRDAALRRRLRVYGAAILGAGLISAAIAYRLAKPDDERLLEAQLNNTKRYEYQMEVMGGKANILAAEMKDWFGGLWRGRGLARTLAFLSVGGSLACFYVAHRLDPGLRRPGPLPAAPPLAGARQAGRKLPDR